MNRINHHLLFFLLVVTLSFVLPSCCKDEETVPSDTIGETTVDLVALSSVTRTGEAEIGNLVADALLQYAKDNKVDVDFAAINAGGIRFNAETLPEGVYPKGPLTNLRIDEMLPFGNTIAIVQVTGLQLKEIFERSVSEVELSRGQFLQVSSGLKVVYDLTKQKQIVDQTVEPNVISTAGERVVSISINGTAISDTAVYTGVFNDFLVEGNDGYVTLLNIDQSRKKVLDYLLLDALKEYIILNTPVSPQIEDRIVFQ